MVCKEILSRVISCTPISSRIITIRIVAKSKKILIVEVYAPTADYSDEVVEEFSEQLEETSQKCPKKNILIVQGDWNAKVGPDSYEHWAGTVGKFSTGETNEQGLILLELAHSHQLTLANTLFPHKLSRRTTWHALNGQVHNQINFILTPCQFKSSINKACNWTYLAQT